MLGNNERPSQLAMRTACWRISLRLRSGLHRLHTKPHNSGTIDIANAITYPVTDLADPEPCANRAPHPVPNICTRLLRDICADTFADACPVGEPEL